MESKFMIEVDAMLIGKICYVACILHSQIREWHQRLRSDSCLLLSTRSPLRILKNSQHVTTWKLRGLKFLVVSLHSIGFVCCSIYWSSPVWNKKHLTSVKSSPGCEESAHDCGFFILEQVIWPIFQSINQPTNQSINQSDYSGSSQHWRTNRKVYI